MESVQVAVVVEQCRSCEVQNNVTICGSYKGRSCAVQDMGGICQSRKGGIPAGVAPGYRHHLGPKDSTMVKETEKRWQKMHGKKGARQYDTAAAAAFVGAWSDPNEAAWLHAARYSTGQ